MKKRINKITFYAVGLCYIAVIVIGLIFAVSESKAQAQDTEPTTITTEAVFYEVPIDIDLLDHIQGLSADYEIPVELVLAVIEVESTYKADAVSPVGAKGLMQIIPEYHEDRMNRLNCTDLFDPYQNVTVGMDFLSELIEKYDGNFHKALTAYNYGQKGAKDKFFGQGTYQTEYSLKVLETAEKIKSEMVVLYSGNSKSESEFNR
jgi:soluble lytic murein transglycosylase-like protein